MKTFPRLLLSLATCIAFSHNALAQDIRPALVPLPSLDDFTRGEDGWGIGLGAGIEYESAYEGAEEFGIEADPAGAVQWRSGDNIFYLSLIHI